MDPLADPLIDNPELNIPTPRPARYTLATQFARFVMMMGIVGGTFLIWMLANKDINDLKALSAHGKQAMASVVNKREHHGKSSSYYLDYSFMGGFVYVQSDIEVSRSEYDSTGYGSQILVTYLPSNPQTHRVGTVTDTRVSDQTNKWDYGMLGFVCVFGLLFGFIEFRFRQHLALLRDGLTAIGSVRDRNMVRGKNTTYYMQYQFEVDGRHFQRKVQVSHSLYEMADFGRPLTILYLPENPSKNIPYPVLTDVLL